MPKKLPILSLLLALCLLLPACAPAAAPVGGGGEPFYRFTDDTGREITLDAAPRRVVALMGSFAETWVLAGGTLAGATEDIVSERGLELPDTEIIGSVKTPDIERILALEPDFCILSADIEGESKARDTLEKAGVPCAAFKVEQFEEYLRLLKTFTEITGRDDLYEQNGAAVERQIAEVLKKSDAARGDSHPTVLFVRALSTKAKAKADDNMTCTMLKDLGCDNIAARHPSLLEELSMEAIIEEDPDFIFVTTMGDQQKALEALKQGVEQSPAWAGLTAVRDGRYLVLPKELFHYKPNARWGESYQYLAEILYPDAFA